MPPAGLVLMRRCRGAGGAGGAASTGRSLRGLQRFPRRYRFSLDSRLRNQLRRAAVSDVALKLDHAGW